MGKRKSKIIVLVLCLLFVNFISNINLKAESSSSQVSFKLTKVEDMNNGSFKMFFDVSNKSSYTAKYNQNPKSYLYVITDEGTYNLEMNYFDDITSGNSTKEFFLNCAGEIKNVYFTNIILMESNGSNASTSSTIYADINTYVISYTGLVLTIIIIAICSSLALLFIICMVLKKKSKI